MSVTATAVSRGQFTGIVYGQTADVDRSDPKVPVLHIRDHHGISLASVILDADAWHALAVDAHEAANSTAEFEQDEYDAMTEAVLSLHHGFRFAADDCE